MKHLRHRDVIFSLLVAAGIGLLLFLPDLFVSPYAKPEQRYRGLVLAVDNTHLQQYGFVKGGSQTLTVRLETGPQQGQEVKAGNLLMAKMESDNIYAEGDRAWVVLTTDVDGEVVSAMAYDHHRMGIEIYLLAAFGLLLVGFCGWGGVRALLSFGFAVLLLWKVFLPGVLRGADPILLALGLVVCIAGVTLFLVAGVSRRALVAWIGALLGVGLTAGLALLLFPQFKVHGAVLPFSETLLYSGFDHIDLGRLFVAAIFIGASGAVIDVAIDVAAAMGEVSEKRPDLPMGELIRSGFVVGRAMVSTMVTTLLMAYMSGFMALLMVLISKGVPPLQIVNMNLIAAELLKTVVGSLGLVAVAPFTAVVGGLLFVGWRGAPAQAPAPNPLPKPLVTSE